MIEAPQMLRAWAAEPGADGRDFLSLLFPDEEISVSAEEGFDPSVPGEYVFFRAGSETDHPEKTPVAVRILPLPFSADGVLKDGEYETPSGHLLTVKNGIARADGYLIVNKTYPLPSDYLPGGLLSEVRSAFQQMRDAAPESIRARLFIDSGYRSWRDQFIIFNGYVARDGRKAAETYSARPGHSEHQSGLAMDLVCSDSQLAPQPGYKEPLDWLNENAWKYGFIKRYPQGKTDETGYIFESWHYRYVGKDLAAVLYNDGDWITMEDYFGFDSDYKAPYGS